MKAGTNGKIEAAIRSERAAGEVKSARTELYDAISMLQSTVETVAGGALIYYDLRRELVAAHR